MLDRRLPKSSLSLLQVSPVTAFPDSTQWELHLNNIGIVKPRHVQTATEGALLASLVSHIPKGLVIVSDDAGQFNILSHSLCWVHAERTLAKLIVPSTKKQEVLEKVRQHTKKILPKGITFDCKMFSTIFSLSTPTFNFSTSPWNVFITTKANSCWY